MYLQTTNSKPPGPIIMIDQSEIVSYSQVQLEVLNCVAPFTRHSKLHECGAEIPIF
jgi:hypothetical protein